MLHKRRLFKTLSFCLAAGLGLSFATGAVAQSGPYPNRPIKLVVPFVPGGTLDVVARMLARQLQEGFKQAVVWTTGPVRAVPWA